LTSAEVTSRLTGGAYLIPVLSLTVMLLLSSEIWGSPSARSGRGLSLSSGLNEYSGRLTEYWIWYAKE
jgi:hypothetical protein